MRRVAADIHERIGRNEATFRSINEDISGAATRREIVEVETVDERHDRYAVVRKLETSGAVAKETDPRA